ncbi:hypothetical protein [Parvibium lacunae]|uniref:Uncharacterized protein n=1 Tax=Parvibium lacunae TaxID=1888893 RepID=A0A368KZK8_9BURK|nr:hypothetical protein [Parvibium lacunae]RCS56745.1 hypothetical protein DU000_10360 [Parvibium lacunae]
MGWPSQHEPFAGEYNALYVDWQVISPHQLQAHQAKPQATKDKLAQFQANPNDPTPIQSLNKDDLTGAILTSNVLAWFANDDGNSQLTARSRGDMLRYRLPSYGRFYSVMKPGGMFGNNGSGSFTGVMMDIAFSTENAKAKDNSHDKFIQFQRQVGAAASAFEHSVPDNSLKTPTNRQMIPANHKASVPPRL